MNASFRRKNFAIVGSVCLFTLTSEPINAGLIFDGSIAIKGRVVARRTADSFEAGSFVQNKAEFLFEVDSKQTKLIKLSYVHFGYSSLPDSFRGGQDIRLLVKRNKQCDETLGSYIASAPYLRLLDVDSGKEHDTGMPGLVWNGLRTKLPDSYELSCYSLLLERNSSSLRH
jgi:hypothetical protein